jgi:chromosome segregation ATPase
VRRGDIREVERIAAMFVAIASLQESCKTNKLDQLLKLANSVESCMERVVEWLHLIADTKRKHIEELEGALSVRTQRIDDLEEQCKYLRTMVGTAEKQIQEERAQGEANLLAAEKKFQEQQAQADARLRSTENSAKAALAGAKEKLNEAEQGAYRAAQAAAQELKSAQEAAAYTLKQAQDAAAQELAFAREDSERLLKALKEQAAREAATAAEKLSTCQARFTKMLKDCKDSAEREAAEASDKLTASQGKCSKLQNEIDELHKSLRNHRDEQAKERTKFLNEISTLKDEMRQAAQKAQRDQEHQQARHAEMQQEIEKNEKAIGDLKALCEDLQTELSSAHKKCKDFRRDLESGKMQAVELQNKIEERGRTIKDLEDSYEKSQSELSASHRTSKELRTELESRRLQVAHASEENTKLKEALTHHEESLLLQEKHLKQVTEDKEIATCAKGKLEQKCTTLQVKIADLEREILTLCSANEKVELEVKDLEASRSNLAENMMELTKSKDRLECIRKELVDKIEVLEQTCKALRMENEKFQEHSGNLQVRNKELEHALSGCRSDIETWERTCEKQREVLGNFRVREVELESTLQKRDAEMKELILTSSAEHQAYESAEAQRLAISRQLSNLQERFDAQGEMCRQAELRITESEAERDRVELELSNSQRVLSDKSMQLGQIEHQKFQLESRIFELEKRLEWERKTVRKLDQRKQELISVIEELNDRVSETTRQNCLFADKVSALERELDKQRALGEYMCSSWKHSIRSSATRDTTLEETLERHGLLLSTRESAPK